MGPAKFADNLTNEKLRKLLDARVKIVMDSSSSSSSSSRAAAV
jgi:hypothetical protein